MPHAENRDCLRGNGLNNGLFKSGHKGLFRNAELSGQPKSEREIIFTRKAVSYTHLTLPTTSRV